MEIPENGRGPTRGGNARGRGARGRRGWGHGRGRVVPIARQIVREDNGDDSGEEIEEELNDLNESFIPATVESDNEDGDENEAREAPNPPNSPNQPEVQPLHERIDIPAPIQHSINYEFQRGNVANERTINYYQNMSPSEIVIELANPFFEVLLQCSNAAGANLTMRTLYAYHAFLTLRTYVTLQTDKYWENADLFQWSNEAANLNKYITRHEFYDIRRKLKGYLEEDNVAGKTPGWKVGRAVAAVQESFRTSISCPSEYLSADEGMAKGSSTRNPIYCSLGKAKPLEGYRFFLLVDYATKIVKYFIPDVKQFTAENSRNRQGGFAGAIIENLHIEAHLPGRWYKTMADNYYNTEALAIHMKSTHEILVCGTLQMKYVPQLIKFGAAKKPKPSRQFPKGALQIAKRIGHELYLYSWMDSAGVYFLDNISGPANPSAITRKDPQGRALVFQVPKMICLYNKYMHGVDVFDQIRKNFGCDLNHRTSKWTVRYFEILFSMILAQAYNIHRNLHQANQHRKRDHYEFKADIFSGILSHPIVTGNNRIDQFNDHVLTQHGPASNDNGASKRKKIVECRHCPPEINGIRNNRRRTSWHCAKCNVGLHPNCFIAYHLDRFPDDFALNRSPPRARQRRT